MSVEYTQQPSLWGEDPIRRKTNRTPDGKLACAFGRPWWPPHDCYENGCCDKNGNEIPLDTGLKGPS